MKQIKKKNSGFSLLELVIAIAVLAFLMLAVSSLIGSSVMQTKEAKRDVRMQSLAQETYSLITDSLMQATDIVIGGYVGLDDGSVDFNKPGKAATSSGTYYYFVKDEDSKKEFIQNCQNAALKNAYGRADVSESSTSGIVPTEDNVKLYSDSVLYNSDLNNIDPKTKVYVNYIRVESSVPLDLSQVPTGNIVSGTVKNTIKLNPATGTYESDIYEKTAEAQPGEVAKKYYIDDTLVSTFYFQDNNLYYSRKYAYMTNMDDVVDMSDNDSRKTHLYNKYFSYNVAGDGTSSVSIPGCVATINMTDESIGIDLYYNQSNKKYTTNGRINTRNSYVLKPKKAKQ